MDKRGIWLIVAIVGLLVVVCCCLVVVTGGLSAFFITNSESSEVMIEPEIEQVATVEVEKQPTDLPDDSYSMESIPEATDIQPEQSSNGLSANVLAQMDQIQSDVESYRELPGVSGLDRKTLSQDELQDRVFNDFFEDYTEEEVFLDLVELSALGLLERDFDLYNLYLDLYSEQIAGFYDDETTEMVVIQGDGFGGNERMTYAHEYTHAMQDAAFDLDDGLSLNDDTCEQDSEYCAAVQALVEGDATLSEIIWFQEFSTSQDQQDVMDFYNSYESPIFDSAPLFLQEDFIFAYDYGFQFVQVLFEQGGYAAINDAFLNPPVSTEQILHPELYPNEIPVEIVLPDLTLSLGNGWESLGENSIGEWYWYLIFGKPHQADWALDDQFAREAAAGWGGDRYEVYYQSSSDALVLVSLSQWDSMEDLNQFWSAFDTYGTNRWGTATISNDNQFLWEGVNQTVLIERSGDSVLWLIAPDQGILDLVISEISGF